MLQAFSTPSVQSATKCSRNGEQINDVPSLYEASIVRAHRLLEVEIASQIQPIRNQIHMILGRGKSDQFRQGTRP